MKEKINIYNFITSHTIMSDEKFTHLKLYNEENSWRWYLWISETRLSRWLNDAQHSINGYKDSQNKGGVSEFTLKVNSKQ